MMGGDELLANAGRLVPHVAADATHLLTGGFVDVSPATNRTSDGRKQSTAGALA